MKELKSRIHDEQNGLDYVLVGDYYIPAITLGEPDDRPIGRWGHFYKAYLKNYRPAEYAGLVLSGRLHSVLADLNEQATERCNRIIEQMKETEAVTDAMKASDQMLWVRSMNSIRNRAEEIIKSEIIYCDHAEGGE